METQMNEQKGRFGGVVIAMALILGLVLGGAAVSMWSGGDSPAEESAEEDHGPELPPGVVEIPEPAQKNAGIQIVTADTLAIPTVLQVTGVVAPEESRVVHVRPLARGVIEQISTSLGARVTKGQSLVTYDNIEMGQLVGEYLSVKAAQRQAETDLDVRRRSLERSEELIKLQAIAQQTLELRRAELKNAEAAVASQRASVTKVEEQLHRFGLSDADLAKLTPDEGSSAHRNSSHALLRAPVTGVVTKFEVAVGELVEPDRELFTITDMSTVWVMADVYEKDLARVAKGTDVEVTVDAYPDRVF